MCHMFSTKKGTFAAKPRPFTIIIQTNMKKTLLSLAVLLTLALRAQAQIVITEIMYNPPESGVDSLEYVELYNNSSSAVDVSGWTFSQGFNFTFPAGTSIAANQYVVICVNPAAMQNNFGLSNAYAWDMGGALTNGGEDIELRDGNGNVIDYVDYKNAAPWPVEPNGGGASLVLCDPSADNSLPVSWQAAPTPVNGLIINNRQVFASPGAAAGCTGGNSLSATNDNVTVPNFKAVAINPLGNDLLPNPVTIFQVLGQSGSGAVNIVNTTINYTPAANFCGSEEITYRVCDANTCDTAVITVKVRCYPNYSIAQVSNETATGAPDSAGVACTLTGTVYGINLRPVNNNQPSLLFTLIDNQGNGIAVSSLNGQFGYSVQEKDIITVRGVIGQFSGLTEIQPDTINKVSANNPLLAPTVVTSLSEATESKLIRINNLRLIDPAEWTTGSGSSGFNVRAVSDANLSDTILIRIDRDAADLYNSPAPPSPFNLTGLGGQFDGSSPFNTGYQVLPRYIADISTLSSTSAVDFSSFVTIGPNPTSERLRVLSSIDFDQITVFDTTGKTVFSAANPGNILLIHTLNWSNGLYHIRFMKAGKVWSTTVVKQ